MNKELIDRAWACVPKEFKEEVKRMYRIADSDVDQMTAMIMLENVFGHHNLTSKAEGEELLTCEKYKVEEALNYCDELDSISGSHNMLNWGKQMIAYLFGSKCLTDKEPNLAEPKFKVGDCVLVTQKIGDKEKAKIVYYDSSDNSYRVEFENEKAIGSLWFDESDLEPYTEPKKEADKYFDNIQKGSFKEHNRLHIAAMIMSGLLASGKEKHPVRRAMDLADALIAEAAKGGDNA